MRQDNTTREFSNDCFRRTTTEALRGIAILLLLLGHLSLFGIDGEQPFEHTGEIAVIIFLYLSAVGLTRTYRLEPCSLSFLYKRVRRLVIPLWLTLALFYSLDSYFLGKTYPVSEILLSFAGIIGKQSPNPPAWFISYILFLYGAFFLCSKLHGSAWIKILVLSASIGTMVPLLNGLPLLSKYFSGWTTYVSVFPLAVMIAVYGEQCLDKLRHVSGQQLKTTLTCLLLISATIFWASDRLKSIQLIILLTLFLFWLDTYKFKIPVLPWLGILSYEIYLLHFPCMVTYGLVVGRKPLWLYFIGYCIILIPVSLVFHKGCAYLAEKLFHASDQ